MKNAFPVGNVPSFAMHTLMKTNLYAHPMLNNKNRKPICNQIISNLNFIPNILIPNKPYCTIAIANNDDIFPFIWKHVYRTEIFAT